MSSFKENMGSIHLRSNSGAVEMSVINSSLQTVAKGYGEIKQELPKGLYQLQFNAGSTEQSQYIKLKPGQNYENLNIELSFPSAAPVKGTSTNYERHSHAIDELIRSPNKSYGKGGQLIVFFRNIGQNLQVPIKVSSYSLYDSSLKQVAYFFKDVVRHEQDGWVALSAELKPGGYILRNDQETKFSWSKNIPQTEFLDSVDFPLWVAPDWTTLVFIPSLGDQVTPSIQNASVHMLLSTQSYFQSDKFNEINLALELALNGLRQGLSLITKKQLDLLLYGKFKNPMLGVVGAQVLLQNPKPDWDLFDTVVRNLQRIVPEHPDVIALNIIANKRHQKEVETPLEKNVFWPPMLYVSYRELIEYNQQQPALIIKDSLTDVVASHLYQQGPWSRWKSQYSFASKLGKRFRIVVSSSTSATRPNRSGNRDYVISYSCKKYSQISH